jgi:3-oxoacyl-[acyl-carrier protein] reductase
MQRVVLVTGGSKGIGLAICRVFARENDFVIMNYNKSKNDAVALQNELLLENKTVDIEQADVSDYTQVEQMVNSIVKAYDRIDVLVNNAGITRDGYLMIMSDKDWNDVINVNLKGVFHCTKAVSKHMIDQKSGAIINISSLSGISGLPGQTNYSASKCGIIAFTKALAKELGRFGIRVNAIAPGVIETDIIDSLREDIKNNFLTNIPLKRFGRPEEVASVVKFLASDNASYITGEVICVTGGLQ